MVQVNVHEAKTHLSKLLEHVERGEEIIIARNGTPVARLAPLEKKKAGKREFGQWRGQGWISPDFDKLPKSFLKYF